MFWGKSQADIILRDSNYIKKTTMNEEKKPSPCAKCGCLVADGKGKLVTSYNLIAKIDEIYCGRCKPLYDYSILKPTLQGMRQVFVVRMDLEVNPETGEIIDERVCQKKPKK